MSQLDTQLHCLHCKGCGERIALRRVLYNPEQFVMLAERFAQEHRDCLKFKNVRKAKAALRWTRICALMEAASNRKLRADLAAGTVWRKP